MWRRSKLIPHASILGDGGAIVVGGTNLGVDDGNNVHRIELEPWSQITKFCFFLGVWDLSWC